MANISDHNLVRVMWILLLAFLSWYLYFYFHIAFSADLSILTSFAERMLVGEHYSESYYDPNPPLNMIIYTPPVWIANTTGYPIYHVHFFYSLALIALSFLLTASLLRTLEIFDSITYNFSLMIFLVTVILGTNNGIGEREHIIVLNLIPFTLLQICITKNKTIPLWIKYPTLLFGTMGILIKPHYGIFPALILINRAWTRKKIFSVLKDPDFWALAIGVLSYGLLVFFLFYDYLTIVLPDVFKLYISQKNPAVWPASLFYSVMATAILCISYIFKISSKQLRIVLFLGAMTCMTFIPFIVQAKALNYHRIPYFIFLYSTGSYALYYILLLRLKSAYSMALTLLAISGLLFWHRGVPQSYITHEKFKTLPLSRALDQYCDNPCSFLMWYDYSDLVHQLAIYHDAFHASRFTSNWFNVRIFQEDERRKNNEKTYFSDESLASIKKKYAAMIIEDLKKLKPDTLIIMRTDRLDDIEYFLDYPEFRDEFSIYKKVDDIKFYRKIYYTGYHSLADHEAPIEFEIYKRMHSQTSSLTPPD